MYEMENTWAGRNSRSDIAEQRLGNCKASIETIKCKTEKKEKTIKKKQKTQKIGHK